MDATFLEGDFFVSMLRPKNLTLMVLVGARTTFPARTNFFFYLKKNQKKIQFFFQKQVFIYIKNPVRVSLVVEFIVLKTL